MSRTVVENKGWVYEISKPETAYSEKIIIDFKQNGKADERIVDGKKCLLIVANNRETQHEIYDKYTVVSFLIKQHPCTGRLRYSEDAERHIKNLQTGNFVIHCDFKHDKCITVSAPQQGSFHVDDITYQSKTLTALVNTTNGVLKCEFKSANPDETINILTAISDVTAENVKCMTDNDSIFIDGKYKIKGHIISTQPVGTSAKMTNITCYWCVPCVAVVACVAIVAIFVFGIVAMVK